MNRFRTNRLRLSVVALFATFGIAALLGTSLFQDATNASSSGPTPSVSGATGEGTCVGCHGDFELNTGTGDITITGLPKNYLPGQEYDVTVTVAQAKATIYGFQMTTIDPTGEFRGTLIVPPATPQPLQVVAGVVKSGQVRNYIEHTQVGTLPTVFGSKSWTFKYQAPARRYGKLSFFAAGNAADSDGSTAGDYIYTTSAGSLAGTGIANFDNDVKSDLSVFRASNGTWHSISSETQQQVEVVFGQAGDVITPGDFDGDGITDRAFWRPSTSTWNFQYSSGGGAAVQILPGNIVPAAADYDGDLKADIAFWRPSTTTWSVRRSSDSVTTTTVLGHANDRPIPADYDGDAKADIALYRPGTSTWFTLLSTDGSLNGVKLGLRGDEPVPGDYDGDGRWDFAVYRPFSGIWHFLMADQTRKSVKFGTIGGRPSPADFDGDGKIDLAVFLNGHWEILNSSNDEEVELDFGATGDIPVPRGYIPQ